VIGVLAGAITLAALFLAVFGFLFSTFTQLIAGTEGLGRPPQTAYRLKELARWTLILTGASGFIVVLCIIWIYVQNENLLLFISASLVLLLIAIVALIFYILNKMMVLPKNPIRHKDDSVGN
jgi:hypothetical protein